MDAADLRRLPGVTSKHCTARDVVCRWDVLAVAHRATARSAAHFLDALRERMPFPVRAIQVDGGPEFKAQTCQERGSRLFVLLPHSPKLNGCVERAQRTHREESYQTLDPPASSEQLRQKLRAWEVVFNTRQPHQTLGYQTPLAFYQQWLTTHARERR